jgi:hypothetical protein
MLAAAAAAGCEVCCYAACLRAGRALHVLLRELPGRRLLLFSAVQH